MLVRSLILSLWFIHGVSGYDIGGVAQFWAQLDGPSALMRGSTDPEACYGNMVAADEDKDSALTVDEYITFAKLSGSDDFMSDVENWEELPLALQSTYLALSCLCPGSRRTNCCDNEINIEGAHGDPTDEEADDLFLVCALTRVAVEHVESSASPTPAPTGEIPSPPNKAVTLDYRVGAKDTDYGKEYNYQLIGAMDALAPEVLSVSLGERRLVGNFGHGRRLQSVVLPTLVEKFVQDECDAVLPSADGCASIVASVEVQFQPEDGADQNFVVEKFEKDLVQAIASGELQVKLETLYPNSPIYIIDDVLIAGLISGDDEEGAGIQAGGIAGLAIASVAVIGIFIAYLLAARRGREPKEELEPLPNAPRGLDLSVDEEAGAGTLGATTPDYGPKKRRKRDPEATPPSADHDSDAGDSGWSSSDGVSSLNTGDQVGDDFGFDDPAMESVSTPSIASIGAQQHSSFRSGDVSGTPSSVTRTDLDSAIEAGDWAAVGATAALLAAASDTNSFSSRSFTGPGTSSLRDSSSTASSYDAARAAELDNLVDAGDWEGVVLAAARYEAASTVASDSESRQASDAASLSSTLSRSKRQQEWRAQVEELVQRVVPEEIENVDEMMLQFRGREDELIETLRTMEERQISKQAREGAQKAAKSEAKKQSSIKKSLFGSFGGLKASASKSLGTGTLSAQASQASQPSQAKSLGTGSVRPLSGREKKQNTLEEAIEAGDWEAVGEAAAVLNDASSASSADTDEINRLAEGLSSQGSNLSGGSEKRTARAEELDKLIDKGDWMGVVQAAADFESEEDKKMTKTKSWFARKEKKEEQEARKEKRVKRLKEEQEALEQAEIWMAIAEKSKDDGDEDKGASDAADWAIGRSLAALVEAEGSGKLRDSYGSVNDKSDDDSNSEDEV